MSARGLIHERLVARLAHALSEAEPGYCLRVDHFGTREASELCQSLRAAGVPELEAHVLGESEAPPYTIAPERAVEIRELKTVRFCLFVPTGTVVAAASSLANSFAVFDLDGFWRDTVAELLQALDAPIQTAVRRALAQLRGLLDIPDEYKAEYLAAVTADPGLEAAGRELWRLGLVPDLDPEGFVNRLEVNARCVRELVRPARAHAAVEERLANLGLRNGAVRDELLAFLQQFRLRDARTWLARLVEEPQRGRLTFEQWVFEEGEESDLEAIKVQPFLDKKGIVEPYCGLRQEGGPGGPLYASTDKKGHVTVKWTCHPEKPSNLYRWRAELIPSRDEYAGQSIGAVELPSTTVSARARRARVSLEDLDVKGLGFQVAQVRVIALDRSGAELRGRDGQIIEGLSQDFWLAAEDRGEPENGGIIDVEPGRGSIRKVTTPTIPLGRLEASLELEPPIEEVAGQWQENELQYYCITLNGRRTIRLGLSPVLKALEKRILEDPDSLGLLEATTDIASTLDPAAQVQTRACPPALRDAVDKAFLSSRRALFRAIVSQMDRGFIETVAWSPDLSKKARKYARDWIELLRFEDPATARSALSIDTLVLTLEAEHGTEPAVVVLPTHPVRVLWYAAYAELLASWEARVGQVERRQRARLCDIELLSRIEPANYPPFVPGTEGRLFLFNKNLSFFWGLAFPLDVRDPARRASDVARVLGFHSEETTQSDLPPERLTKELTAYREIHPYLETLRMNVVNAGSGEYITEALRGLYRAGSQSTSDDADDPLPPLRVEVLCHAHPPMPFRLPALARLQQEIYEAQPPGRRHHLAPYFAFAIRPMEAMDRLPGGEVNLSIVMDDLRPEIRPAKPNDQEQSASFHGLLSRLWPNFVTDEGRATWIYGFSFPNAIDVEPHPVLAGFTRLLVDAQAAATEAAARLLPDASPGSVPTIVVELTPDELLRADRLHHHSDWVVTMDRFFGVEFFDNPTDAHLGDVARKYLLDYAPEFLDGLGHRMLVTTSHREEVEEVLARAMRDLGFAHVEDSVGDVLHHLKTISGRLALRTLGGGGLAKEAVSLGVVAAYLRARGELSDSVLIPVDSHPELFAPSARRRRADKPRYRCDLIRVRFLRGKLEATFIEVKSREAAGQFDELCQRIAEQINATEDVFRRLFFATDPVRLDHSLQRSRLATILSFYLKRARRYGLITSPEQEDRMRRAVASLERRCPELKVVKQGFVVSLTAQPRRPRTLNDIEVRFITAQDVAGAGFVTAQEVEERSRTQVDMTNKGGSGVTPEPKPRPKSASQAPTPVRHKSTRPWRRSAEKRDRSAPQPSQSQAPRELSVDLGTIEGTDESVTWKPSVKGSPHLFILGIPGQGKSWAVTRLLIELAQQGLPALVIDFHGQFLDPEGPYPSLAQPFTLDAAAGLPFSPFEAEGTRDAGTRYWITNCFAVAEIFQYVAGLGDIQRDVVYEALRNAYVSLGFEDGKGSRLPTLQELHDQLEELEAQRGVKNVIPRCRPLLEFGLFRDEAEDGPTFEEMLRSGLVIGVQNLGLESLQMAAGAFVLRKVYKDMFRWGETDRLRLVIVLDEAHRLARDITLPKIMKEGRKFGIAVIVASQGLADFHPDVVGNAGTKVVFRTNFPMSKKVAGFLRAAPRFDLASSIEQLEVGEAYVQTPEMPRCTRVRMHPLELS